ncbi:MAG: hypothetical protein KAT86_07340, partial [Candidatus Latescibacteria bacterium]|nr:hypothetical protein [Candidatus Latescibacterota bacterium]
MPRRYNLSSRKNLFHVTSRLWRWIRVALDLPVVHDAVHQQAVPRPVLQLHNRRSGMINTPPRSARRQAELNPGIPGNHVILQIRPILIERPQAKHLTGAADRRQIGGNVGRAVRCLIDRNGRRGAACLSVDDLFPRFAVVRRTPYRRIESNTWYDIA